MKTKLNKGTLLAAAKDLNDTAGLEPAIGYDEKSGKCTLSKMNAKELKDGIIAEVSEYRKTDKYQDPTWDILEMLDIEIAVERAAKIDEEAKTTKADADKKTTKATGRKAGASTKKAKVDKPVAKKKATGRKAGSKSKKTMTKKPTTTSKKATTKKPATKSSTPKAKKLGIIATILVMIGKKPMTRDQILTALVKKFPDRRKEGMWITVQTQVPLRLTRKGHKITKDDKGRYSIK